MRHQCLDSIDGLLRWIDSRSNIVTVWEQTQRPFGDLLLTYDYQSFAGLTPLMNHLERWQGKSILDGLHSILVHLPCVRGMVDLGPSERQFSALDNM